VEPARSRLRATDLRRPLGTLAAVVAGLAHAVSAVAAFTTFESGPVRPLALSPDGTQLFVCNTPDDRVDVLRIDAAGTLIPSASVTVGLEPVAVAARSDGEIWVVNHLSDSVSVVDVSGPVPRVVRTLLVGDEPRDVVFAGPDRGRAFITTARRGQNLPPGVPALPTTPSTPRALVWVFDADAVRSDPSLGGTPSAVLELFADTPRALAVSPDGATVYAAAFLSGNQTTTVSEGAVCDGGAVAPPCGGPGASFPGGLPAPNVNHQGVPGPETGLIARFDGSHWVDTLGRAWDDAVRFSLPDLDVFAIDATASPPALVGSFAHVGTTLFNMVVNPATGRLYVTNTEARNDVRFEGPGGGGSTVQGHLAEARITIVDGAGVRPRRLNPHIDYTVRPSPPGTADLSLATPLGMAVSSDGRTLYVAAFGSDAIGVFDTSELEAGTFVPSPAGRLPVAGGPCGVVLDEARDRLYVSTRFDDAVAVVDLASGRETSRLPLYDPEPPEVVAGRPLLYDARATSSNGEAACASCHVFADLDALAWDLGNPDADVMANHNPFHVEGGDPSFHPLKGPMTTQSLRGLAGAGPMHWRGDRSGGNLPGGDPLDTTQAFGQFIVAFESLLGRAGPIASDDMDRLTRFVLSLSYPPNPFRNLDGSLTLLQQAGHDVYFGPPSRGNLNCSNCHVLQPARGFFGTDGTSAFQIGPQPFKIPHLRNLYQKIGMFGMPAVPFLQAGDEQSTGPQIRGFGFLHDGSVDTLLRFHGADVFRLDDDQRTALQEFLVAYDSNLAPIVGQQATLSSRDADAVAARIDLLLARAAAGECDLVAKGIVFGEARGFLYVEGAFRSDRVAEAPWSDAALRTAAAEDAQELTYTCVPPGSGVRVGIDRDEDGVLDRDELDAGTDPADPQSPPHATPAPTPSPIPTTMAVTITTSALRMVGGAAPVVRRLSFRAASGDDDPTHGISPPQRGGPSDPVALGGSLRVYNASGETTDDAVRELPAGSWRAIGGRRPLGFVYRPQSRSDPVRRIVVARDRVLVTISGRTWDYTLDEPSQGAVGIVLRVGATSYCAQAPPRRHTLRGRTTFLDHVGLFVGAPNTPPPPRCPPAEP